MREIKFRGLPACEDKDELDYINFDRDGNFAVGFYEDGYIIGKVADASDDYISPEFWVAVDRNTVGQYTGLHDKNGREIYEGDIVKWGDTASLFEESPVRVAVVKFDPDICFYSNVGIFDYGSFAYKKTDEYLTVIGNIWENPEKL